MRDSPPTARDLGTDAGEPVHGAAVAPCDVRCHCGSLLARRIGSSVELKCRRCKRTLLIPFES